MRTTAAISAVLDPLSLFIEPDTFDPSNPTPVPPITETTATPQTPPSGPSLSTVSVNENDSVTPDASTGLG